MDEFRTTKVVGKRRLSDSSPIDFYHRALVLQKSVDELNPYPRPRGFVFKAKTWEDYELWKKTQSNPRLW